MKGDSNLKTVGYILLAVVCIIGLLVLRGCDRDQATEILEAEGYSQIVFNNLNPYTCAEGEAKQGFTAVNPYGEKVDGVVCMRGFSGYVKTGYKVLP
jgi:hypothetical protein